MTPKFLVARGGRVRKNYDKRQRRLATDKENKRVRGANSRSVKPLYVGSIPTRASSIFPRYPCRIGFSTRVNGASRAE